VKFTTATVAISVQYTTVQYSTVSVLEMECICYVKFTRHRRVVVGDIEEFALVAGKITLCVETFPAFRTHVLQIPRVQSLMSLKVWSLVECLVAECAAEHPLATVHS